MDQNSSGMDLEIDPKFKILDSFAVYAGIYLKINVVIMLKFLSNSNLLH